jgi:hypothetical protein
LRDASFFGQKNSFSLLLGDCFGIKRGSLRQGCEGVSKERQFRANFPLEFAAPTLI